MHTLGKRFCTLLLVLCATLMLAGCATVGRDFDVQMVRKIKLHQTTRDQIEQMFGFPWRTGIEDGKQTWSYGYYKYGVGDSQNRDLVIRFNPNGTVASYSFSSNRPEDQGL